MAKWSAYINESSKIESTIDNVSSIASSILQSGFGAIITVQQQKRSDEQRSKMWAMLYDISEHVIRAQGKNTPDEWKAIFTASMKKQKIIPGIEGEMVVCGYPTSEFSVQENSDMIELMYAFGADNDVKWSEPTKGSTPWNR